MQKPMTQLSGNSLLIFWANEATMMLYFSFIVLLKPLFIKNDSEKQ